MLNGKTPLLLALSISLIANSAFAELSSKAKRAEKLAAAGKTDEAMAIYKELMAKNPDKDAALVQEGKDGMAAILLTQAKAALDAGDFANARDKAQSIVTDYKNSPSVNDAAKVMVSSQLELCKRLIESKKYDDCIAQAKDVRKKIPAGSDALKPDVDKMLSKLSGDLLQAGEEGIKLQKYEASQKLLDFAAAAAVEKADIAKCKYTLAKCLRLSNQTEKAVAAYQDVTTNFSGTPAVADAYADLFLIYQDQGKSSDALNSIKQAVTLAPASSDYLFKEAQAYAALGKADEAKKDASKVIDLLQAEIAKTYINKEKLQTKLGQAHLMLGHYTEAGVEFEKALARNPNIFEARKGLALAQFNDKDYKSAVDSYDSLIKLVTTDFNDANDKLAKNNSSAELGQRVEDLRKDIAYFHFQKGLCFEGLVDYDKALAECRVGFEGVSTQEAAAAQKRILAAQAAAPKKTDSAPAEAAPKKSESAAPANSAPSTPAKDSPAAPASAAPAAPTKGDSPAPAKTETPAPTGTDASH